MRDPEQRQDLYVHHSSFPDLQASANSGCSLCQLFIDALTDDLKGHKGLGYYPGFGPDSGLALNLLPSGHIGIAPVIDLDKGNKDRLRPVGSAVKVYMGGRGSSHINIFTQRDIHLPDTIAITGKEILEDPASDACFGVATSWINVCTTTHKHCPPVEASPLPTRVLDVGLPDGSQEPYLFITQGIAAKYVTLSHCWGKHTKPTILKTTNIESLQQSIPLSTLSPNFRDAVTVTRRLGLRYIWIDSLCIIQDSAVDWELESAKMASVYRNSLFTISALGAGNSDQGFLNKRELYQSPPIPDAAVPGTHFYARLMPYSWKSILGTAPLNKRGWTLQERLLSPRVLHYTPDEMHWECETMTARESDDEVSVGRQPESLGPPNQVGSDIKRRLAASGGKLQDYVYRSGRDDLDPAMDQVFLQWYTIVAEYSTRALTKNTDKLPALSGFATRTRERVGGTYLAGLWKEDLLRGLHWWVDADGVCTRVVGRAPSWSWAAVDAPVRFHPPDQPTMRMGDGETTWKLLEPDYTVDARILGVEVEVADRNPTGRVNGGVLRATGTLKEVVCSRRDFGDPYAPSLEPWRRYELRSLEATEEDQEEIVIYGGLDAPHDLELPLNCWYFRLATWGSPSSLPTPYNFVSGMVLVPTGRVRNEFQRIGMFWTRTGKGWIVADDDIFSGVWERREIVLV